MPYRHHTRTGQHRRQEQTVTLASATIVGRKTLRGTAKAADWQTEAWSMYDTVGELGFASRWLGAALSRCGLFIAEPQDDGVGDPIPMDNPGPAGDLLTALHYGPTGQGEMLRRMAVHLTIPGETYLVGMDPDPDLDGDVDTRWLVCSTEEFTHRGGGKPRVTMPETGQQRELDPDSATIIRIWKPHPKIAWQADSSVKANLPPLREVVGLSRHVTATVDSRLAGAGMLVIPHSASMPSKVSEGGETSADGDDGFMQQLTEGMITPIQDPEDASAVVPLLLRVSDEAVGKIQHISFSTPLDDKAASMREAALRRFARGSDLPPEIIEGQGDTNHWSAWQVSESALTLSVEPLLGTICDALTQQYLWPALKAAGVADAERYLIWYDTSELSQRPDRSKESQELWRVGELSAEALRRENGFGAEDEPDDDERKVWRAWRLVEAQPGLMPWLAGVLGFDQADLPDAVPANATGRHLAPVADQPGDSGRPELPSEPSPEDEPTEPPNVASAGADGGGQVVTPETAKWLLAAVEQGALRALELASKRLVNGQDRSVRGRVRHLPQWDAHTIASGGPGRVGREHADRLLRDGWSLLEQTLPEQECIHAAVAEYCRDRLLSARSHSQAELVDALTSSGCLAA